MLEKIIYWLQDMIAILPAVILAITVHESAHGWVAYKLGDPTAKNQGRLTLNPLKHLDPIGVLCLIFLKFGWARPVPVNMYYFKKPKTGMAICAAAGPVSNLLMAFFSFVPYKLLYYIPASSNVIWSNAVFFLHDVLFYMVLININFAVFNLIPIPPLDGSKILGIFLPSHIHEKLMRVEQYGMLILVVLLYTHILDAPLNFLRQGIWSGMVFLLSWF